MTYGGASRITNPLQGNTGHLWLVDSAHKVSVMQSIDVFCAGRFKKLFKTSRVVSNVINYGVHMMSL